MPDNWYQVKGAEDIGEIDDDVKMPFDKKRQIICNIQCLRCT